MLSICSHGKDIKVKKKCVQIISIIIIYITDIKVYNSVR